MPAEVGRKPWDKIVVSARRLIRLQEAIDARDAEIEGLYRHIERLTARILMLMERLKAPTDEAKNEPPPDRNHRIR